MLSHKSLASAAALAILCSVPATSFAAESDTATSQVCITGGGALHRNAGHPGKSLVLPRRNTDTVTQCSPEVRKPLILTSFLDAAGGQALVDGRIKRAASQIDSQADAAPERTNLCVLRTLLRDLPGARTACDSAVESALRERAAVRRWDVARRQLANKRLAVAFSNRGVMHWLAGDSGASYGDLANARSIDPKAAYIVRNFELTVRVPARVELPVDQVEVG